MTTDTDFNPEDFVETAHAVTTACAEADRHPCP